MEKIKNIVGSRITTATLFIFNLLAATTLILSNSFFNTDETSTNVSFEKIEIAEAAPDPSNKFLQPEFESTDSKRKMKGKGARAHSASRMPASEEMATFVIQNGIKKLVIKVNILCSSWNYLLGATATTKPLEANVQLCEEKSLYMVNFANMVFEENKYPVYLMLNSDVKYDSYPVPKFSGPFSGLEEVNLVVSSYASFDTAINNRDFSNPDIMPAIVVEGILDLLNKTSGSTTSSVDKSVRISVPLREQKHIPTNISCNNPNSLKTLTNFEANWGITLESWRSYPVTGNFGVGRPCGTCPNQPPAYHRVISALTSPFGGPVICEVNCVCAHEVSGNNQYIWDSAFNGIKMKCGDYPGDVNASSGYNECGYKVISSTSPNIYIAKPDAFLLRITDNVRGVSPAFSVTDEIDTLDWFEFKRRNYFPYTIDPQNSRKRPYEITLLIRPFTYRAAGVSSFIGDLSTKSIVRDDGRISPIGKPSDFFSVNEGAILINLNFAMNSFAFAHEVGHMLGGWHQPDAFADESTGANPIYSKQGVAARKLGAYKIPETGKTTLMWSIAGPDSINSISSRTKKTAEGYKLGKDGENRYQMAQVINWLAGERLDKTLSFEMQSVLNLLPSIFTE